MLDIIVTHYKEPWDVGAKFFAMLDLQRGINFDDIKILLIHDGTGPFPDETFAGRPYRVEQHTIEHGGISAARNAGIRMATAEWIMFCDFDDTFSGVYALRDLLSVLPNDQFDMLWAPFIAEDKNKNGELVLYPRSQNLVFIHAKMYRRQFILDNDLSFDLSLEFNEDSAFNAILNTIIDSSRIGEIKTPIPPYVWAYNPDSLTTTPGNRYKALYGLYNRNKAVVEAFRVRLPHDRYCAMVARACVDAYYILNLVTMPDELRPMLEDFVRWYRTRKDLIWEVDVQTIRQIKAVSRAEHAQGDKEKLQRWDNLAVVNPINENLTVTQWLKMIERMGEECGD